MLNNVSLMGRLTATPELKYTPSNIAVTSFSIAVDRNYGKGEDRQTDFINIVCWRATAEFVCRYFQKGSMIALTGSIQTRSYNDKEGNKRTAVEVLADHVFFGESKKSSNSTNICKDESVSQSPAAFSSGADSDFEEIEDDPELPF